MHLFELKRPSAEHESQFHAPTASFAAFANASFPFTNDFVAYAEPRSRLQRVSALADLASSENLLLAYADARDPGALASVLWPEDNAAAMRKLYAFVPPQVLPDPVDIGPVEQPKAAPVTSAAKAINWSLVERDSRQVLRGKLDDIQRLCGQKFTLDATCDASGSNKQFARCCAQGNDPNSLGPFSQLNSLHEEHVWMSLTSDTAAAAMQQYLELKANSPTSTSGCFLVPYRPDCEWLQHFSHMQLLKEYAEGTSLFFVRDGKHRRYLPGVPGSYRVYYDPPDPAIAASSSKPRFLLKGRIFTAPARVMIDGGANTQYIGADTCRQMGASIRQLPSQPKAV